MSIELTSTQKLLIALISNLTNERGYCFATNQYLGECLNLSVDTVSGNISELVNKNWLGRIIKLNDKHQVELRILTVVENRDLPADNTIPPGEDPGTPTGIKAEENNKVFNNKENSNISKESFQKSNFNADTPVLPEVERVFLQQGGTKEMAQAFFNKYSAVAWMANGSQIKNFSYLIPSFIINWNKINIPKPKNNLYSQQINPPMPKTYN